MSEKSVTAKDIFVELVTNVAPENWEEQLAQACHGDDELRSRVRALLRAHAEPGSFLDQPALATDGTALHESSISEQAGAVIGSYKLLQQIGEGGMGVVFMAEQTEPIHRTVALKIIKPGMDTRQVIARFEAERQALAMMDHPNIARVLDAGTTDTGRPYFVMDLVKGVPITEYCNQQHLPVRQRLELMNLVCHAVQHAHQKGIIHRDLKPSNVLVAEYDGKPVPKVIDFGVAKATAQRLTERTMFTEYGQLVGTFEYMSPEQARFNQLDVDTRSDIYSLGVLLYEVLAGSTPLEKERLRSAAFDELLRIICEEEPPRPSLRLSSSQALPSISAQRQIEPEKLKKLVRGELDWIVMKCLEKDRNRRYETASALAVDLQRYLNDEPVTAKPTTQIYRLKKFVRRNKIVVTASAAVSLALVVGVTLASVGFFRAREQAEVARTEAMRATAMTQRATQIQDFLREMLTSINPEAQVGSAFTVQQMLDQAGDKIDSSLDSQPEVRAVLHETIGETYYGLQLYGPALKHFHAAVDLRRHYVPDDRLSLANALMNLAKVEAVTATNLDDARSNARECATIFSSQLPENDWRRGFAQSMDAALEGTVAGASSHQIWSAAAVTLLPFFTEDLLAKMPVNFRAAVVEAKRLQQTGDHKGAMAVLRRFHLSATEEMLKLAAEGDRSGLERLLRQYLAGFSDIAWVRPYLPLKAIARAQEFKAQGGPPLAVDVLLRLSIEMGHEVWGKEHPHIAIGLHELATLLQEQGKLEEAETTAREAFEMRKKVLGLANPETAKSLELLIDVLQREGKSADAEKLRREISEPIEQQASTIQPNTDNPTPAASPTTEP